MERRYLRKDETEILSPRGICFAVARNIALMDILYDPRMYSGKELGAIDDNPAGSRERRG